jgi:hypothetical protein
VEQANIVMQRFNGTVIQVYARRAVQTVQQMEQQHQSKFHVAGDGA